MLIACQFRLSTGTMFLFRMSVILFVREGFHSVPVFSSAWDAVERIPPGSGACSLWKGSVASAIPELLFTRVSAKIPRDRIPHRGRANAISNNRMLSSTTSRSGTPKHFHKVLSLGMACDTAFQIRRNFAQTEAYPFDWWITPYDGLRELIAGDFAGLLSEENLERSGQYVVDHRFGLAMMHDFENLERFRDTLDAVRAKYRRRISRWLALFTNPVSVLFVRGQQYADDSVIGESKARALLALLRDKYPKAQVHLLVQNPPEAGIPELMEDNLWILQLKTPDPWEWYGDNTAWREMFSRIALLPTAAPLEESYSC